MTTGGILGDAVGTAMAAEGLREMAAPGPDGHTHETACLNCGTPLAGHFCHACGQAAHVHRSLMAFVHDIAHGVFHFEGKIWRTIPALMLRPGQLTRDYIEGRRVRYVSPIALFLFSVFLLFAVVKHVPHGNQAGAEGINNIDINGKKIQGTAANEAEVVRLKAKRAQLAAAGQSTEDIDDEIEAREGVIEALRAAKGDVSKQVDGAFKAADKTRHYSDIPELNTAIAKARANPELALYKLQSNAYKYAWALIPLSVPLLWLLFPFSRRFGLYDHTVFVTYSLCAMSLLVVLITLLRMANVPGTAFVAMLYPPWHMYRQIKDAYGLSRFSALWRTWVVSIGAVIVLTVFAVVLVLIGVAG
ncbi:MAG: DUF3667 domain-containing protein [Proteobacteria bacterium]|nr:DUF3667 domain-containing protein [Pseudomonadota bacterium]